MKRTNCLDSMCGALDCGTCYPFQNEGYRKWFLRNFREQEEAKEDAEEAKELEADREKD